MKGAITIGSTNDKDCNCCHQCFELEGVKAIRISSIVIKVCSTCFKKLTVVIDKEKAKDEINENVN